MSKLSIRDLPLNNHRILMRVDFNVPIENGRVTDDTRIRETLPTIEYALRHGASRLPVRPGGSVLLGPASKALRRSRKPTLQRTPPLRRKRNAPL